MYWANASVAIEKALAAAGEAGGGTVYFPRGTYFINSTFGFDVPWNVKLEVRAHDVPRFVCWVPDPCVLFWTVVIDAVLSTRPCVYTSTSFAYSPTHTPSRACAAGCLLAHTGLCNIQRALYAGFRCIVKGKGAKLIHEP